MTVQAIRRPRWLLPLIQFARRSRREDLTAADVAGFLACSAFWTVLIYGVAKWAVSG